MWLNDLILDNNFNQTGQVKSQDTLIPRFMRKENMWWGYFFLNDLKRH